MSLSDANIFQAQQLLKNFPAKKSTFIDNQRNCVQILCLVGEQNEILVHFKYYGVHSVNRRSKKYAVDDDDQSPLPRQSSKDSSEDYGDANWKLIVWFQQAGRTIQDLCFDPNGRNLLVVCYDNTLHIVPILWIIDPEFGLKTTTSQEIENFYWPFRCDEISSFIVPFSGPHECSNSKTCPNNSNANVHRETDPNDADEQDKYTPKHINQMASSNSFYQTLYLSTNELQRNSAASSNDENESDAISVAEKSPDGCEKNIVDNSADSNQIIGNCPYPLSVVWWSPPKTDEQSHQHRAIIGYSDGSICVVGLAPNCPFIANTSIENKSGGIAKMTICRDTIVKSVSLLITATSHEQWKLLLEQNSIGYVFPDEIQSTVPDVSTQSPSHTSKPKNSEEDWQFVIPISMADASGSGKSGEEKAETKAGDEEATKDEFIHVDHEALPINGSSTSFNDPLAQSSSNGGIFPAARARLASLRDLGAKKIGALKLKLIENKIKSNERDRNRQQTTQLACMHMPSFVPEILTTTTGPFFIAQFLRDTHLLSALHAYSDTLSVHSMDISLIPLYIYKIPKDCSHVLITPNIMYTKQQIHLDESRTSDTDDDQTLEKTENSECPPPTEERSKIDAKSSNTKSKGRTVNALGVIGCNSTTLKIGEDSEFNASSMLGLFPFPDEKIIDIHRVPSTENNPHSIYYNENTAKGPSEENPAPATTHLVDRHSIEQPKVSTKNYIESYSKNQIPQRKSSVYDGGEYFTLDDRKVVEHIFPTIELDQCMVVTNRSLYQIEFCNHPHIMFLNMVKEGQWKACEEFCTVFNLDFNQCVEYAGDVLLKKEKTTQALLTYNIAKIPPVKTALKLAMFGQNSALMHLCAMALKIVYILRSAYPKNHTLKYVNDELKPNLFETTKTNASKSSKKAKNELNAGVLCSDFSYDKDETPGDLQMSNSSQFHLSNLLLLTLTEKAIKDKQLMPLWNFLIVNKRYHTNMSSIVLAQSGLYSSTIVLALNRGAHMDAFCALVGVTNQEFGWYSEINEILYQLSDPIFMECIIYLQSMAMEYFDCIQTKCHKINSNVLERLRQQLDPFAPIFRPVVSQLSSNFIESDTNDLNKKLIEFCKHLIETFLTVIIKLYTMKSVKDEITNGLNVIYIRNEQNQFAIKVENSSTIAAGFSHCAAIVDGSCYLWGSSGVNCALNCASSNPSPDSSSETSPRCLEFISNMGLEVHAVKMGRAHTLILTNNGLYAMGSNMQNQLGIGKHQIQALQPMLVEEFDGKNISLIEAGQYHNAVYADNELYTFGYGIYGQLGHGNVFGQERPKVVKFFSNKNVQQIACGHAHTLVLTKNNPKSHETTLYFFGCNLFGQSGLGQYHPDDPNQKLLKTTAPTRIDVCDDIIVQIHTKFFTNFVVTRSNKLYTWGASPQLIRLLNQARKRARLEKKFEETKNAITNDSIDKSVENIENPPPEVDDESQETVSYDKKCIDDANAKTKSISDAAESNSSDRNLNGLSKKNEGDKMGITENESVSLDRVKNYLRTKARKSLTNDSQEQTTKDGRNGSTEFYLDDEYSDHFHPTEVDTSDIVGEIIQVSSGLYHNVLITNTSQLYTWGKNLEKQLGKENPRCDLLIPTHLELNDNVIAIDCGADFTLILTDHYTVKAFGNNNVGQCGREMNLSSDRNGFAGKLVRLKVSKRVVRLPDTSQCLDQPMDVLLPRPKIRMNFDAVRYLKNLPKYRPEFVSHEIFRSPAEMAEISPSSDRFDDNSSTPDADEQNVSPLTKRFSAINLSASPVNAPKVSQEDEVTSEFIHYCLFILHGIYDAHKILDFTTLNEFKVRILMLNYYVKEAFKLCLDAAKDTIAMHQSDDDVDLNSVMLTSYVIKLFEYFTKDASIVPIHRTDLKYLIHAIFMYFIENSLPMKSIEVYFLNNVDHYLFGLAFVLFFGDNNNTSLERKVHRKYSHLFGCVTDNGIGDGNSSCNTGEDDENGSATDQQSNHRIDQNDNDELQLDFELIFKNVSTSFKTIICQRLIEFDNELN